MAWKPISLAPLKCLLEAVAARKVEEAVAEVSREGSARMLLDIQAEAAIPNRSS